MYSLTAISEVEAMVRAAAPPALDLVVDLGNTSMRLVSNSPSFAGPSFFSDAALLPRGAGAAHELWCLDDPAGVLRARLASCPVDSSYRGRSFALGYYATDHFGEPVALYRFDNRYYVVGQRLERVMWTYFVKRFIFLTSLAQNQLFLKAACVAFDSDGILILGRGSGGKTTLVRALCRRGARLVTNSHAILDGLSVTGVRSTMRVRDEHVTDRAPKGEGLRHGEVLIDPFADAGPGPAPAVRLTNICIVDYRPDHEEGVRRVTAADAIGFAEQFAVGVNVYRLEEEMLEFFAHSVVHHSRAMLALHLGLRSILEALPCYVARTDIRDEGCLARLFETVGLPWDSPA